MDWGGGGGGGGVRGQFLGNLAQQEDCGSGDIMKWAELRTHTHTHTPALSASIQINNLEKLDSALASPHGLVRIHSVLVPPHRGSSCNQLEPRTTFIRLHLHCN